MSQTRTFPEISSRHILCGTCPHFNTICTSRICFHSRGWNYLPRHLATCLIRFGFHPTKVFLKSNNSKIRFLFSNRPHLTFSVNCFCSGRELKQSLGVCLWRNPTIHQNFSTFGSEKPERFYLETKLAPAISRWFEEWKRTGTITIQESDF